MKKYLYDVFLTREKNHCTDLVLMAWPMLQSDARTGVREYTAEETDLVALHTDYMAHVAAHTIGRADMELCRFLGRHGRALAEAYQYHDRAAFDAVVAGCIQADEDAAKERAQKRTEEADEE